MHSNSQQNLTEQDALSILGLSPDAGIEEIKQAFRNIAKRSHPDIAPEQKEHFYRSKLAHDTLLRTTTKYAIEVAERSDAIDEQDFGIEDDFSSQQLKNGVYVFLTATSQDAISGAVKEIQVVEREDFCPRCSGSGTISGVGGTVCKLCHGKGHLPLKWGKDVLNIICNACSGSGFVNRPVCNLCKGTGRVSVKRKVRVPLPKGIRTGTVLKIPGQGRWCRRTARREHIYAEVRVEMPTGWQIRGIDLHTSISVDIWTAMKGGITRLDAIDGELSVNIHAGARHGDVIKVPERGWIDDSGERGYLFLSVALKMPDYEPPPLAKALLEILHQLWPVSELKKLPDSR